MKSRLDRRIIIGFHASHEQFTPSRLLQLTQNAVAAGFNGAMCSDHFHPWSTQQGQSGFAWSWLAAALQATASSTSFGVVTTPGYRYHPAILAQAAATLTEMFPGRFWIALGSGELLNEGITGKGWPVKSKRNAQLQECAEILRKLWAGQKVTSYGHVWVEEAKLYTRPDKPPLLLGAALTPETAEWLSGWADGLITTSRPKEQLREVVEAFRRGGGKDKPLYLKVGLSYAPSDEEALKGAWEQWRFAVHGSMINADLSSPEKFEAAAQFVSPEQMRNHLNISADPEQHISWLKQYIDFGFENIYLHNVNREQEQFIKDFGEHVLPALI